MSNEKFETLQQIVVDVAAEIGLTINQTNVLTSSDNDAKQLAKFVIATCEELLTKFPWRTYIGTDPWVLKTSGDYAYEITADEDVPQIDARLLKLGTRWRYLHSKGMTYNEDFRSYQIRISAFAYNRNKEKVINMNIEEINT